MNLRLLSLSLGSMLLGGLLGAFAVNTAGYDALQDVVQAEIREMRRRGRAGDEVARRAFDSLSEYIHGEPGASTVFFLKGLHIYDEGFWYRR